MPRVLIADESVDRAYADANLPFTTYGYLDGSEEASAETEVLVVRSRTKVSQSLLATLPNLKVVIRAGSGTNNIDLDALRERGILLLRNAEIAADAVAEWAVAALIVLTRKIAFGHNQIGAGRIQKELCMGDNLSAMSIAIWGAGPIGQAIASRVVPLVRDVTYAQWPSNPLELTSAPSSYLLRSADVHIIALPLRSTTVGYVDSAFLSSVSDKRPYIVCPGRLETLDVHQVSAALVSKTIRGLAVDAIDSVEGIHQLRRNIADTNVLLTPHVGAQRTDVRQELDKWVVHQIKRLAEEVS